MSKNKVQRIIDEGFDSRLSNMLAAYMVENGFERCRNYTDEQVENATSDSNMFGDYVIQEMLKTARKIATEVSVAEFLKWVQSELNPCNAPIIEIWDDDMDSESWKQICDQVDVDYECGSFSGRIILED